MRGTFLEPALDARALNLQQQALIANSTEEIDSLVEIVRSLARSARPDQRPVVAALVTITRELARLNQAEGELQRQIAGAAHEFVSQMRSEELAGRNALATKSVARALRSPLEILRSPEEHTEMELARARRDVLTIVDRVGPAVALHVGVRHEIGVGKYTTLVALVDRRAVAA
jgi:hypothetical protein